MRWLAVITLLTAITPGLSAQQASLGSPRFAGRFNPQNALVNGFGRPGFGHHDRSFGGAFYYPLFSDALYDGYSPAPASPVVVVQSAAAAPAPEAPSVPIQPLMIELQGDRYVQVTGKENSSSQMIDRALAEPTSSAPAASEKGRTPVVLVFRDGHREQVSAYTITDGSLYAPADYYRSGSWNRKIELSALNLPETVEFNQSHGLQFQLPTAPNEVIVGP